MPTSKFQAELRRQRAAMSSKDRKRIDSRKAELLAHLDRVGDHQKDVLRRLVPRVDPGGDGQVEAWAAARSVGISDEEFWRYSPREVFAVLEVRAFQLGQKTSGEPKLKVGTKDKHSRRVEKADLYKKQNNLAVEDIARKLTVSRSTYQAWRARDWPGGKPSKRAVSESTKRAIDASVDNLKT